MTELSRLRWQCRRGTRELDLLLENYLDHCYVKAGPDEQQVFLDLLALQDSELLPYLMGDKRPVVESMTSLINKIRVPIKTQSG